HRAQLLPAPERSLLLDLGHIWRVGNDADVVGIARDDMSNGGEDVTVGAGCGVAKLFVGQGRREVDEGEVRPPMVTIEARPDVHRALSHVGDGLEKTSSVPQGSRRIRVRSPHHWVVGSCTTSTSASSRILSWSLSIAVSRWK